jgi:PEP-CTERM motif
MKNLMCIFVMLLLVATVSVEAETYGGNVSGLWKVFNTALPDQATLYKTYGLAFDPSHQTGGVYDRVYIANHTTDLTRAGLYSVDTINETTASMSSRVLGSVGNPSGVAVGSDGTAYVSYDGTPALYKVANPSSLTPTETQLMGNYGDPTIDDAPSDIAMVPIGFGGGYDSASDVVIFDCGLDGSANSAVSVLDQSTGTVNTIWESNGTVNTIRGDTSSYDGYAYFADYIMPETIGSLNYINRVNSSGILERIFLNVDPTEVPYLDSAVACNPADGSFWMVMNKGTGNHDVIRVDVSNATLLSGTDYIADVTIEIDNWVGTDIPNFAMEFSPDGKMLAMGWDQGVDRLYIYNVVPEPTTMLLLATGLVFIKRRRSK